MGIKCSREEKLNRQAKDVRRGVALLCGWFNSEKITIFLFVIILLFLFICNFPATQSKLKAWQASYSIRRAVEYSQKSLMNDPPLGLTLSKIIDKQIINDQRLNESLVLVCVLKDCNECKMGVVQKWVEVLNWETWRKEVKFILVIQSDSKRAQHLVEKIGLQVLTVADENGRIVKTLNAVFSPRVYGFSEGRLVWLQKDPETYVVSILSNFIEITKGKEYATSLINRWSAEMREKLWGQTMPIKG